MCYYIATKPQTCGDVEDELRVDVKRRIADVTSSIATSNPLTEPTANVVC